MLALILALSLVQASDTIVERYVTVTLDCHSEEHDVLCTIIKAELIRRNIEMPYRYLTIKSSNRRDK
jgi:hypothetical protein